VVRLERRQADFRVAVASRCFIKPVFLIRVKSIVSHIHDEQTIIRNESRKKALVLTYYKEEAQIACVIKVVDEGSAGNTGGRSSLLAKNTKEKNRSYLSWN